MFKSFRNRLYYDLKPFVPQAIRHAVRRWFAGRKRPNVGAIWPILPGSERAPEGWPGWPDGKRFAVVLTHDVERIGGLQKCRQLMELEMRMGFRSSFNFVPEGDYRVSREFREELVRNGFEVGVHDLRHDGKLYRTREAFARNAQRINEYLKDWGAVGFRSGFMLHNLDWLRDLDVAYDMSTFDTDPFEPQPDGAGTIFPFWVPGKARNAKFQVPNSNSLQHSAEGADCQHFSVSAFQRLGEQGYIELPYSLPADSTLFLLLREKSIAIWERKLEWIARHGGMALLNTHPDYMNFAGRHSSSEFPSRHYEQFLEHIRSQYAGQYWHALPREVAEYARENRSACRVRPTVHSTACYDGILPPRRKVWIDLENTPHIPFFKPIIRELENRGCTVVLTARDAFQTREMATQSGLPYLKIGRHYGRNRVMKVLGLLKRSMELIPFILREKPDLGLNHGSRAQILACNLLRIPTVLIMDYEHTSAPPMVRPWWEIVPEVVSQEGLHCKRTDRIRKYSGIKEDVYVPEFKPDPSIVKQLGLNGDIVVTVRPPATEAHYHNPEAEILFARFMDRIYATPGVKAVLLPRNKAQQASITAQHPEWFKDSKVIIPSGVVDGLNLLWHSDLAVSGGGTMNREAAALGVPVYSVFRGKLGAVDRSLRDQGRLVMVGTPEDVDSIVLQRRARNASIHEQERRALHDIIEHVTAILDIHSPVESNRVRMPLQHASHA
ncbi:MAG TPA: DUF354 domain-containing protein [Verrucomicrobia bacterium]|nr:DUF354 domain-containing protein [Verrucomicrobiota bacterium]